jgi:two-component system, OmpR family, response regulator
MTKKILIVDDDPHILEVVRYALERGGFDVEHAEDGAQALEKFKSVAPDLMVLDIMMPEIHGTEVCREIRKNSKLPIIFLSSCDEDTDRIIGLEIGGDDYVTKPFSPKELVARVRAVLRRATDSSESAVDNSVDQTLRHNNLNLNKDSYKVFWKQNEIILTATEFYLLRTFISYPAKVYSRNELMESAYENNIVVTDRTIDSHIRRIRKKFKEVEADPIETVHGIGYKLAVCE